MAEDWHYAFNPERFLKRVDLNSLLKRNSAAPHPEHWTEKRFFVGWSVIEI
jgi:hypothetical protein